MATKKSSKAKSVKPGLYNAMITKVDDAGNGRVTVQLQLYGRGFTFTENHTLKVTNPTEGTERYYIICSKLSMYTAMGADNRHHAANKATKLFGPGWTSLTRSSHLVQYLEFVPVLMFKELISGL